MNLALYPSRVRSSDLLDGSARPPRLNLESRKPYTTPICRSHVRHYMSFIEVTDIDVLNNAGRNERPVKLSRGVRGQHFSLSARSGRNPYAEVTWNREPKATK